MPPTPTSEGAVKTAPAPRGVSLGVEVLAFDGDAAGEAANLRLATRAAGLSLGDRACLALARQLDLPAVTADRLWEGLELTNPVAVVVIR